MEKLIKVRWLRKHREFAHAKDSIGFVTSENAEKLSKGTEEEEPYVKILPDNYEELIPEKKVINASVKGRVLKYIYGYAYKPGDIGAFTQEDAVSLLEDDFIEVLPDDFIEPGTEIKNTEADLIDVKWKKHNSAYAYSPGDNGQVMPDQLNSLVEGGYVEHIPKVNETKQKMLTRLKNSLKKK